MKEYIQRIPEYYIGEDCAQLMIEYQESLTIINKYSLQFHQHFNDDNYTNSYTSDERRFQFPYHNIPVHLQRNGIFKYNYVNQLFKFDEPYIEIVDNKILERVVIKDKEGALSITKPLLSNINDIPYTDTKTTIMTRREFEQLFKQSTNPNEYLYTINSNGILLSNEKAYKTEKELAETIKKRLIKQIELYKERVFEENESYHYFDEFTIKCFESYANSINSTNIASCQLETCIIIKTTGTDISIKIVSPKFVKKDYYAVTTYDIPITKYTLEQVKFIKTKILNGKEPKIPLRLNPNITKEEVKKAKSLLKTKTNSK